jgi:pyridoxine/pyridoxamine 5'-phosphate oxidase
MESASVVSDVEAEEQQKYFDEREGSLGSGAIASTKSLVNQTA